MKKMDEETAGPSSKRLKQDETSTKVIHIIESKQNGSSEYRLSASAYVSKIQCNNFVI